MLYPLTLVYGASLVLFLIGMKAKKNFLSLTDTFFLFFGLALHCGVLIKRGIDAQRFPLTDTYETLVVFSFMVVLIGTLLYFKYRFVSMRIVTLSVAIVLLTFTMFIVDDIRPLMPSLRSKWLYVHVGAYIIAYSSFAISFGFCLMYGIASLLSGKQGKHAKLIESLEGLIFKILDIGFPFLTVGLATGAIWASISWGRFWSWDPKEVWALVTWLIYAGCLHLRHTLNLRSKYAALLAGLGFIAILFTYIGVNLLFDTIHAYA